MANIRRFCEPCLSENEQEKASMYCYDCNEYLCDSCGKLHKKFKTFKGHNIGDLLNVPFVIAEQFFDSLTACPCSTQEHAVFYCIDHKQMCCNNCTETVHSVCTKLDSQTFHARPQSNDEVQQWEEITSTIDYQGKQVSEIIDNETKVSDELVENETSLTKQLHTIKASIEDAFNQLESRAKREFSEAKETLVKSIESQEASAQGLKAELKEIKDKTDLIDNHGNHTHKILFGRSVQVGTINRLNESIDNLYANSTAKIIESQMTTCLEKVTDSILSLIQVQLINQRPAFLFKPPVQKEPRLLATLNLREKSYKDWFYPEGCVWIGDFIVISISGQNVVKLVDVTSYAVVDTHVCRSEPLALCAMQGGQVGVWLPKDVHIDVLAIEDGRFKHVKGIEIPCKARDIQFDIDNDQFVAMCREDGAIKLLDTDGEHLESLSIEKKISETVEDSLRFRFSSKHKGFYISGYCMHHLVGMNLDGEVIFDYKHKNLRYPVGCDLDDDGNIFVASWKGQSIHEVSKLGEHKRVLLEGELYYPQSLCFNGSKDKFAVIHTLAGSHLHVYSFED